MKPEKERYHRRERGVDDIDIDERSAPGTLVKSYPTISYATECTVPIVAFDKLDGSNVRAEWTSKKGWSKFGTRTRLVDVSDSVFGKVPTLITEKYGEPLGRALKEAGYERAMCFFEFWGPKSFAGMHDPSETQTVTLIDVAPFTQGILEPKRFLKYFGHIDHAKVLYEGLITGDFVESVRAGTLPGMTFEGVVCKGKNDKKTKAPIMLKQKSRAWLDKLREHCGNNDVLFKALK